MSIQYCHKCDSYIDTDLNAEHFDEEVNGCEDTSEEETKNKEFSEVSFEEGYATARRIYEPVVMKTLNVNGDEVTHKIEK